MSYTNTIKRINNELLQLIEKYHNSPLDDQTVEKLKRLCNSFNTNSNNVISTLEERTELIDERIIKYFEEYKSNKLKNVESFNNNINYITKKYVEIISKIKEQNDEIQANLIEEKKEYSLDHEILIRSNEQKLVLITSNELESIKRYELQIENAFNNYDSNIVKYNNDLSKKLEYEAVIYNNALVDFDKEVINYIADVEKRKIESNTKKQEFIDKLAQIENNKKQKLLLESINQNKIINASIADRNVLIDNAKKKYQTSINKSQEQRDKYQQELKNESNNILREFVYGITVLDEKETKLKQDFLQLKKEESFHHFVALKKISKNEETKIVELYKLLEDSNQKILNKSIKAIKKFALAEMLIQKKHYDKIIKDISLKYFNDIEELKHKKILLELDKNCKLDNINVKELALNKYFQEHNNIFEATLNTDIKIANLKYHQKANQTKYQNSLKKIEIEKDFDVSEANFKKKLEMIDLDIKMANNQISSIRKLKNLLHNYEDSKYDKKTNYINVDNLLEIELNRILKEYNQRQYLFNVNITKLNSNYSKGLLKLDEEKSKNIMKLKKNKLNLRMEYNTKLTGLKVYEQSIYEENDRKNTNANMAYDNSIVVHRLLTSRFKEELKGINFNMFALSSLLDNLKLLISKITPILLSYFKEDLANCSSINRLFNDLSRVNVNFFRALLDDYKESVSEIIYRHNEFEEKIKFKANYEAIVHSYENDKKKLINKKQELLESIESNNQSIKSYQNRVYSIQNLILVEENKIGKNIKYLKSLKSNFKDSKQRIKQLNKMNSMLSQDLSDINESLIAIENDYNHKIDTQKNLQYESAKTYYDLRRQINAFTNKMRNKEMWHPIFLSTYRLKHYTSSLNKKLDGFFYYFHDAKKTIYKYGDNFIKLTNIELEKNLRRISNNHNENLLEIKKEKNKSFCQNLAQIQETTKEYKTKLNWANMEIKSYELSHKLQINEYEQNYNTKNNVLINKQRLSLRDFYSEFNAMLKNKDDLRKNFDSSIKSIDSANMNAKNSRNKRDLEFEIEAKQDLNLFIKTKDELIEHLPAAVKRRFGELNKALKDLTYQDNLALNEAKSTLNQTIKQINRHAHELKLSMDDKINENNILHQKNVLKAKRAYQIRLKHGFSKIE